MRVYTGVTVVQSIAFAFFVAPFVVTAMGDVFREPVVIVNLLVFAIGPLAVALAIARYRLYEIDHLVGRTFVYGALTAILAGLYAASLKVFQVLFTAATGESSDAALVLTTLVLVATFTPVKSRLDILAARWTGQPAPGVTSQPVAIPEPGRPGTARRLRPAQRPRVRSARRRTSSGDAGRALQELTLTLTRSNATDEIATDGLALATRGLQKRYGSRVALAGLDLSVPTGVVYGFLGPNGAGKTTTMRLLTGLIHPDAGTIELLGRPFGRGDRQRLFEVGALIESPSFYPYLSGRANLRSLAASGAPVSKSRIEELLALVGLQDRARDKVSTYSLGMKQRLGIAGALLSDPRLLLLDEPSNGLDPAGIVAMRETLRRLASIGKTVFVSSHVLGEVQQLADVIGIIASGRLVREGPIEQLLLGEGVVRVRVALDQVNAAMGVLAALVPDGQAARSSRRRRLVDGPPRAGTRIGCQPRAGDGRHLPLRPRDRQRPRVAVPGADRRRADSQPRGHVLRHGRRDGVSRRERRRWNPEGRSGRMRLFVDGLRKLVRRPATYVTFGLLIGLLSLILIAVGATAGRQTNGGNGQQALPLVTFPAPTRSSCRSSWGWAACSRSSTARRSPVPNGRGARSSPRSPEARAGVGTSSSRSPRLRSCSALGC